MSTQETAQVQPQPLPQTESEQKPQKPISKEQYLKLLRVEAEIAKLRAQIAQNNLTERMSWLQIDRIEAAVRQGRDPMAELTQSNLTEEQVKQGLEEQIKEDAPANNSEAQES